MSARPPAPDAPLEHGFRVRGVAPSRLEAFSDAVFAFAVTLLVVSLDVPRTFDELRGLMAGFVGFAFSFAMIVMMWRTHSRYFRRFGLDDGATVWLNSILLFLVLFFVYPLKFLFTMISSWFVGPGIFDGVPPMQPGQGPDLMLLYGGGFAAVFVVFGLMYANALRLAGPLALSPEERARTRTEMEAQLMMAAIGLLSVGIAYLPSRHASLAGFVYFLIGPTLAIHGYVVGRRRLARAGAPPSAPPPAEPVADAPAMVAPMGRPRSEPAVTEPAVPEASPLDAPGA